MNSSFSSPSELSSNNQDSEIFNQYIDNYQLAFDSSSDVNPRKNSPIPSSPPNNIEIENETNSLDHLSYEYAFKRLNHDYNSHRHLKSDFKLSSQSKTIKTENFKNEKISFCLDRWCRDLKSQVLMEFEKTKLQILEEEQKKMLEEKEKQKVEINQLKQEIQLLKETVKLNEKNILKKESAIENITKAFEKQREKNELQRVMMEWKFKRLENAKEAFTTKLADKYYVQRLKLKIFLNWQYFLMNKHKVKVEKACKRKAEEVCYDLATNYEAKIKKIEEELNLKKLEIEKYKTEMNRTEENMRKALMRGVCALNMEAMSIFNENSDQENQLFEIQNTKIPNDNLNQKQNCNLELEKKELARKVKSYCETSLSLKNKNNLITNNNMTSIAKTGLNLLKTSLKNTLPNEHVVLENNQREINQKVFSNNNKMFDELTQHNIMVQKKTTKHSNVKSKIGSLPSSQISVRTKQLSSSLPPLRSVVIEKHTNKSLNHDSAQSRALTKVK